MSRRLYTLSATLAPFAAPCVHFSSNRPRIAPEATQLSLHRGAPPRGNHAAPKLKGIRYGDHEGDGAAGCPCSGRLRIGEEEDEVAEARHPLDRVGLKGLGTREEKRHDRSRGVDVLDLIGGNPEVDASAARGCGGLDVGCPAEDARDEQTVPRTPGVQRPAVNGEAMSHFLHREAAKPDDLSLLVRVD